MEEKRDISAGKSLLIIPFCYFELSDGFIVLYEFPLNGAKNFNMGLVETEQGDIFLGFFDENKENSLAFPVDKLIEFISRRKIESVSIALYSFRGYGAPAAYISTVIIPVEMVYEIKGAVKLVKKGDY